MLAVLVGCGGALQFEAFFYRFTNVIPDLVAVDFIVEEEGGESILRGDGIVFSDSTEYFEADVDTTEVEDLIQFDLYEAGTSNQIDTIIVQKLEDVSHHVFAFGMATPGGFQPAARLVAFEVTRTTPTGSNARLIVVHGYIRKPASQTPPIDFVRSGKIDPEIEDLDFAESSVFLLAAGTYDLTVRIAGFEQSLLIEKLGVTFEAGKIYIVLLLGVEDDVTTPPDIFIIEEPIRDD